MKKMLIRSGLSPLENLSPAYILQKNSIGNNVGNLVYAYSIFRTLMMDDTELVSNHYKIDIENVDQINEEYDCFVIPLADAFRNEFMSELRKMTEFIKKLTIPCIVIGVGLRASFEPDLNQSFLFDKEVKEFIKAVLDKSAIVGVRGEITSAYLSKLGFREEIDHTVIGCPSMYMFGKDLTVRDVVLTEESMVSVNNSIMSTDIVRRFLERSMEKFPNHYFIPQRLDELRILYTGAPYTGAMNNPTYPSTLEARLYKEDRVRFFCQASAWLNFLKKADLSFGCRLHGNIAAILAGTPALLIPHDARMRELTEYHNLTHIWAKEIDENSNIFELIQRLDFRQVLSGHGRRFDHYLDFLEKNSLSHIFIEGKNPQKALLDHRMEKLDNSEAVVSIRNCSLEEMIERWNSYYPYYDKLLETRKVRLIKAEKNLADYKRKLKNVKKSSEQQLTDCKKKIKKLKKSMEMSEAERIKYKEMVEKTLKYKLKSTATRIKNKWKQEKSNG